MCGKYQCRSPNGTRNRPTVPLTLLPLQSNVPLIPPVKPAYCRVSTSLRSTGSVQWQRQWHCWHRPALNPSVRRSANLTTSAAAPHHSHSRNCFGMCLQTYANRRERLRMRRLQPVSACHQWCAQEAQRRRQSTQARLQPHHSLCSSMPSAALPCHVSTPNPPFARCPLSMCTSVRLMLVRLFAALFQ